MTTNTPTLGHVHLQVSNLENAIAFYRDVVGLEIQQRSDDAAFMSFDGYHHHLGLNTWRSKGAGRAPRGYPGLFHTAFLYPDRAALGQAIIRATQQNYPLQGAADHGVSEAVYLSDPDGNGVELYRDRAEADWPRNAEGVLDMVNAPLDVQALIDEGQKGLDG
jgi:catechol 2,3-dioxygenase